MSKSSIIHGTLTVNTLLANDVVTIYAKNYNMKISNSGSQNATALQNAINAAAVEKTSCIPTLSSFYNFITSSVVIVSEGSYDITGTINVPAGVSIKGSGRSSTELCHQGGNVECFNIELTDTNYGRNQSFSDFTLIGKRDATKVQHSTLYGFKIKYCIYNCSIKNVNIFYCHTAVFLDECYTFVLDEIQIFESTLNGIRWQNATAGTISNIRCDSSINDHGCYITDGSDNTETIGLCITRSAFQGSGKAGIMLDDVVHTSITSNFFEGNNRLDNNWGYIHSIDGVNSRTKVLNIQGCFFTPGSVGGPTSKGIKIERSDYVNITGVQVRGSNFAKAIELDSNVTSVNMLSNDFGGRLTDISNVCKLLTNSFSNSHNYRTYGSGMVSTSFTANDSQHMIGEQLAGHVGIGSYDSKPAIQGAGSGSSFNLYLNPGNGNVSIGSNGGTIVSPQSKLHVNGGARFVSTTDAVRFPTMTTTERNAITPLSGMVIFNTTTSKLEVNINGTTPGGWTLLH